MTNTEFIQRINKLLTKVSAITFDDYSPQEVIREIEAFIKEFYQYLNPNLLEDIAIAKEHFAEMRTKKKMNDKMNSWQEGVSRLRSGIESILFENQFPDNDKI